MVKAIAQAEAANAVAFSTLVPLTWQRKWVNKALPWAVSANVALDGNPLNLEQIEKIVVREPSRDEHVPFISQAAGVDSDPVPVQEVINFFHTLKFLADQTHDSTSAHEFTPKILLDLHSLVTERAVPLTAVGAWRNVKLVVKQETGGSVIFQPPTPIELKYQLDDFWTWLNSSLAKELPVLIKAAICWAQLSKIYPFAVANGRVTRAFVRLVLGTGGFRLAELLPYEQFFLEDKALYYQTLVRSIQERDFSPWIEYYLNAWQQQAKGFLETINSRDMKTSFNMIHQPLPLRERQIKIMDFLQRNAWVSVPQINELFPDISDDSILRDLRDLMVKGLVKKRGKTKSARYTLKGTSW